MKWVIYREMRDFVNLHAHYRVANFRNNIESMPDFPVNSLQYLCLVSVFPLKRKLTRSQQPFEQGRQEVKSRVRKKATREPRELPPSPHPSDHVPASSKPTLQVPRNLGARPKAIDSGRLSGQARLYARHEHRCVRLCFLPRAR